MENTWREVTMSPVTLCFDCGEVFYAQTQRGAMDALDHTLRGDCIANNAEWLIAIRKSVRDQVKRYTF